MALNQEILPFAALFLPFQFAAQSFFCTIGRLPKHFNLFYLFFKVTLPTENKLTNR